MSLFRRMTIPQSKLKLHEIIPLYDIKMHRIMLIGLALYEGYLADTYLVENFAYLKGFHDYRIYTQAFPNGQKKRRKTLQVPKFTTEYLAKLIYTEKVVANTISKNEKVRDNIHEYLMEVLKDNDYWSNTSGLTEVMFNIGGAIEKPTIKNGKLKIEFIDGTKFDATEYDSGGIKSGIFTTKFVRDGYYFIKLTKYTLLNSDYKIEKELYKSKQPDMVGNKVKYEDYFDDLQTFTLTNFKSVPFSYRKPRIKNNQAIDSPYGLPIWFNAIDTIGDLDLIFDRKNTEVEWGGRQKVIPAFALKETRNSDGVVTRFADPNDPTIMGLDLDPENPNTKPVDLTSDIRHEPFVQLLNQGLNFFCVQVGYDSGTFTSDSKGVITATQALLEKGSTNQTKQNQEMGLAPAHANLFMSIIELAHAFKLDSRVAVIPDDLSFEIVFDDSIIIDKEKTLEDIKDMADTGKVPIWYYTSKKLKITLDEAKELYLEAQASENDAFAVGLDSIENDNDTVILDTDTPTNGDVENIDDIILNGAQISSAVQIVEQYNAGILSRDGALVMLTTFLNIPEDKAEIMLDEENKKKLEKANKLANE